MPSHKWVHQHSFSSEELNYDQFKCRKCKLVKRNMLPKDGKLIKVLVQGNERESTPVPPCTGYQFRT